MTKKQSFCNAAHLPFANQLQEYLSVLPINEDLYRFE